MLRASARKPRDQYSLTPPGYLPFQRTFYQWSSSVWEGSFFFSDRREVAITIGIFDLVFDLLPEETLGKKDVWK